MRLLLTLAGACAVSVAFACTTTETKLVDVPDDETPTDAGFDSKPPENSGLGELLFRPDTAYSGFDGVHTFKVPIAVYDSSDDLTVTADDPSAADVAPTKLANPVKSDGTSDNGKYFMITVKKVGTITLTAKSKTKTTTATITVAQYDGAAYAEGESRYNNAAGAAANQKACSECHVQGKAIDHSPAALATATDSKIAAVIRTGISTAGFPIRDVEGGHKWEVTDPQRDGLVVFLRGIEPRGFK